MLRLSLTFPRQTEEASRATPLEQDVVCSLECCATSQPVQMYDSSVLSKTRKLQVVVRHSKTIVHFVIKEPNLVLK